jgi:FemAB-related protein (PEP-CTERM system-associated)
VRHLETALLSLANLVAHGGRELLGEFYAVFAHNMRDLGTPVYSRRFFDIVAGAFPERTHLFCVRHQGRAVAAALAHHHDGTFEIPWASALRESNSLCANVLLYWEMLKWAAANGFARVDFGRSTRDSGTFKFKRQWGAVPHDLVWEYWTAGDAPLPDLSPANPRYRTAIAVWRRLPVPVTAVVGPFIARHLP